MIKNLLIMAEKTQTLKCKTVLSFHDRTIIKKSEKKKIKLQKNKI